MKKLFKKRNLILQIAVLSVLTLLISSCEKEAMAPGADNADLKRGRAKAVPAPAPGDQSIAEIAIGAGFSELVGALAYVDEELDAGLVDLFLNGTDQYTVFAPGDDAFKALYEALEIDGITDLPAELVLDVLFYHVAEGRRAANSVVPRVGTRTIETLLGATFDVNPDLSIVAIGNTANIVGADISASNGIIHVIDAVILPIGGSEEAASMNENVAATVEEANAPSDNSIAAIAIDAGFSELVGALFYVDEELDAGLVDLFLNGTD
ncbi:MAG: fasciclin domain-containing protein, partial [Bacteroidales bacterium]|nr:fasciclin domain-containing protein [Bacteroidales bacterium]